MAYSHTDAIGVFQQAAKQRLEGVDLQIMRSADDLYRDVASTAGSRAFVEADTFTRVQMSQAMTDEFAKRGVHAVTYADGRQVGIGSYSEMVGRTTSGRATMQGSLNRYQEHGYDLVQVSAHFRACDLCVPYENAILTQSGRSQYPSLADAVAQGLFHPNCAHNVTPYIPGVTPETEQRLAPGEAELVEQHGYREGQRIAYKAQQRQRQIERSIREWKTREAVAIDPKIQANARRKVQQWQAAQRGHMQANPYLQRMYSREGIGKITAETVKAQAQYHAQVLAKRAARLEPRITQAVQQAAQDTGSQLAGLEFRLKTEGSLSRKIAAQYTSSTGTPAMHHIANDIGDTVRYTFLIDERDYATHAKQIFDQLRREGLVPYDAKFRNYWQGDAYKGLNTNWTYQGQKVEIQFHTPASFRVKEEQSHAVYERLRQTTDVATKEVLQAELRSIWEAVNAPSGSSSLTLSSWKGY